MKTKVQVKDLKAGDLLSSGTEVITGPVNGYGVPTGKMAISVKYANGNHKVQLWNKSTTVTVTNR